MLLQRAPASGKAPPCGCTPSITQHPLHEEVTLEPQPEPDVLGYRHATRASTFKHTTKSGGSFRSPSHSPRNTLPRRLGSLRRLPCECAHPP